MSSSTPPTAYLSSLLNRSVLLYLTSCTYRCVNSAAHLYGDHPYEPAIWSAGDDTINTYFVRLLYCLLSTPSWIVCAVPYVCSVHLNSRPSYCIPNASYSNQHYFPAFTYWMTDLLIYCIAENPLVSFGSLGEGWHNWHHKYPFDYAASEFGIEKQFNPTKLFIDVCVMLGLASDCKRATGAWTKLRVHREELIYGAGAAVAVEAKKVL